ncbi:MAG: hypothetical protein IBJ10_05170 [Phycisphaerales bacterium]|nr:hypothetical protein [Phycisphaerales bacterium]
MAALAFVAVSLGIGAWAWRSLSPKSPRPAPSPYSKMVAYQQVRAAAPSKSLVAAQTASERKQIVSSALEKVLEDPDGALTDEMRRLLIESIAAHVSARAAPDASEYMQLVDAERMSWITPDEAKAWALISERYSAIYNRLPDRSNPRQVLQDLVEYELITKGEQLLSVGMGAQGSLLRVARVHTPQKAADLIWLGDQEHWYWHTGNVITPYVLRRPVMDADRLVARHGSVVVADASVVVTTPSARPLFLYSRWVWNPTLRVWHCRTMYSRGWSIYVVVF